MTEAIKKIKRAIEYDPKDEENWVLWGLIMRTVGNYKSSLHKYKKALKINPNN
jgi:Tfp pilus assembly protein PilF